LSYEPGPHLDGTLDETRLSQLRSTADAIPHLQFQQAAISAVRDRLPSSKGLIGFVGGPWTLFVYAVEGTHSGTLSRAKASPALYRAFADRIVPLLIENIRLQFDGGADIVMVFDTAAGELGSEQFREWIAPDLLALSARFPQRLGYYARGRNRLVASTFAGTGLDWTWDLSVELARRHRTGFLQGNFDPSALAADSNTFRTRLNEWLRPLQALDVEARRGWICGLGHGVLPATPEDHVRAFVGTVREALA